MGALKVTTRVTGAQDGRVAVAIAEAGLWVSLLGGLLGLVSALRTTVYGLTGWSFLVASRWLPNLYMPSLPATIRSDDPGLQLPALAWKDTVDGTVDAATGLPPVSIGGPVRAVVEWPGFTTLTPMETIVWLSPAWIAAVGVLVGSWLLLRIARSARKGEVFTLPNAHRLRWLALLIAVAGLAHNAVASWGPIWILTRSAAASHLETDHWTMSFSPALFALVVAALAVIWEGGVRLAQDSDGLI